jgi:hypothetical protein
MIRWGIEGRRLPARIVAMLKPGALAAHGIGDLRYRASPGVQGGYVANGCPGCDALIGRVRVEDLVREHVAAGGTIDQLAIRVTVDLLSPSQGWPGPTDLARVSAHPPRQTCIKDARRMTMGRSPT